MRNGRDGEFIGFGKGNTRKTSKVENALLGKRGTRPTWVKKLKEEGQCACRWDWKNPTFWWEGEKESVAEGKREETRMNKGKTSPQRAKAIAESERQERR